MLKWADPNLETLFGFKLSECVKVENVEALCGFENSENDGGPLRWHGFKKSAQGFKK